MWLFASSAGVKGERGQKGEKGERGDKGGKTGEDFIHEENMKTDNCAHVHMFFSLVIL